MVQRNQKRKSSSVRRRILVPTFWMVAAQIVVLLCGFFGSGLLDELNKNAFSVLQERVSARATYLESDMVGRWSNLEATLAQVNAAYAGLRNSKAIDPDKLLTDPANYNALLEKIAPQLIATMRTNGTNGVFVVLNNRPLSGNTATQKEQYPGIYIRDLDPVSSYTPSNGDLLLEYAPTQLVQTLGISTDTLWKPLFTYEAGEEYDPFMVSAYEAVQKNVKIAARDLGHWSTPYQLQNSNRWSMAYCVPLVTATGEVYGVLGVELLLEFVQERMPFMDIGAGSQGMYAMGVQEQAEEDGTLHVRIAVSNGPQYANEVTVGSVLKLNPAKEADTAYEMKSETPLYASVQPLNLYNTNTPFFNQKWVLLGFLPASHIFDLSYKTTLALSVTMVCMLITSIFAVFLITQVVSKPMKKLAGAVRSTRSNFMLLPKTQIMEVDALAEAIEELSIDLHRSASKFTQIVKMASTQIGGFEVGKDDKSLFINDEFFEVFGMEHLKPQEMTLQQFKTIFEEMKPYCVEETDADAEAENSKEYVFHMPSQGEALWVRLKVLYCDAHWYGLAEDISRSRKELEKAEYERDHDVLTGLYNRRAFNRIAQNLFTEQQNLLGCAALLMFDLDNLKQVNDTYGHDYGDLYICAAAQVLQMCVDAHSFIARMSGDEFMICFYGYDNQEQVEEKIAQVHLAMKGATMEMSQHKQYPVRASGGVAWYPKDSRDFSELKRYADFAMYRAKNSVKGDVRNFDLDSYQQASSLTQDKQSLLEMLKMKLVDYHFQPIVNVRTGQVFAYEALMRPALPTLRSPQAVLSLAKQEKKLDEIERITWFCAMEAFTHHCQYGTVAPECRIFVNSIPNQVMSVQALTLFEHKFAAYLPRIVQEHTEEEVTDADCQEIKCAYLKRWNAQMALDDYGSGYNSGKMLLSYNPDYVKIDICMVANIDTDDNKRQMVEALIKHAKQRGMLVIAEGIETKAELQTMVHLGIDFVQGYYVARPALIPPAVSAECLEALGCAAL